ncbi:deoxyribodipyrimidine photo-lyase [uncultured Buchnera sp.]|jgi:deoxyribodipyrimidine photo-lyase|uniref:deoxyribodipyrimidine photo-lyase n=1 Tax=uncultured Buchnera sp. TaxID=574037 RepID=UPI0025EED4F5|nr:deoxyribodipyrimidine photo-lyase [uncultured Buchnera sp.]
MKKNLIWFRNDLRLYDNTALHNACMCDMDEVIGLFISTPQQWKDHFFSSKKISFIYQSLISLQKELFKLNIILHHHECPNFLSSIDYLIHFCEKNKINSLFYNYQYEINERNRDYIIKKKLSQKGVVVKGFHDSLLISIDRIKNKNNKAYKIFSFFKKKVIYNLSKKIPECFPIPIKRRFYPNFSLLKLFPANLVVNFDQKVFPIGERQAINRLKNFCIDKIEEYSLKKNFPFLNGTSMLSPYLSLGIISPRYCLNIILKKYKKIPLNIILNSDWLNEIIWREFYYHLLVGFPILSKSKALVIWEEKINWTNNINYFNAWKNGNTGFPIVDAGMRQLNQTGWMHNRLRMITSSFLVKNLLINWRKGEKYFMSNLIDGDFALNNGGWQWSASTGSDSVPYIRVFNPLNQSKKFDRSGLFIRKYIPELNYVPDNYIHNPYEWSIRNNCKINYPEPIIDYKNSKKKVLLVYNKAQLDCKKEKV